MQIRQIEIRNFRGIRQMEWSVHGPITCLIGPGNSTKSTILDAIEYALSPRWNLSFEDCDFYQGDTDNPLEIVVTVGQLPDRLLSEQKFGLYVRGWSATEGIRDEPREGEEFVLSVRLRVGNSLEPEWAVKNDRDDEGRKISHKDREILGVTRLRAYVDRHLSWGRGSALSQLTSDRGDASSIITEANRRAQKAARDGMISEFKNAARTAQEAASELGVQPRSDYIPALDPRSIGIGVGAISIHEGNIPLRQDGLGNRRLVALGLQFSCVKKGAILLIDEVEHALEPHRIRHLLRKFQQLANPDDPSVGQIIMTSHNHTVVVELASEKLCVVRSKDGTTVVRRVGDALQSTVRSVPESLLGRKVLVCEGKTEYGFCRSLEGYWVEKENKLPLAYVGAVLVEGGGNAAPQRALELAGLGYAVCLLVDSDKLDELVPNVQTLRDAGVKTVYWEGNVAIEERITLDVPWEALKDMVALAVEIKGEQSVFDKTCSVLGVNRTEVGADIDRWRQNDFSEEQIRNAIGESAKTGHWFKRIDHGEALGRIIVRELANMLKKDLAVKIKELGEWMYG